MDIFGSTWGILMYVSLYRCSLEIYVKKPQTSTAIVALRYVGQSVRNLPNKMHIVLVLCKYQVLLYLTLRKAVSQWSA